jgi:hypothetical protein
VPGEAFDVVITFTADETMNAVGLADTSPVGSAAEEISGGTAPAAYTNIYSNAAEFIRLRDIAAGTEVIVSYRVTLPPDIPSGTLQFSGNLRYYVEENGPFSIDIGGDTTVTIQGESVMSVSPPSLIQPPLPAGEKSIEVLTADFTGDEALVIDETGIVRTPVTLVTEDSDIRVFIDTGTIMLGSDGQPLQSLTADLVLTPPAPPPGGTIALAYDFGPDGAIFEPAISLIMPYDPALVPEGADESGLRIAYWDGSSWVFLETIVDTVTKTLTCKTTHFTPFAVMAVNPPVEETETVQPEVPELKGEAPLEEPVVVTLSENGETEKDDISMEIATAVVVEEDLSLVLKKWFVLGGISVMVIATFLVLFFTIKHHSIR